MLSLCLAPREEEEAIIEEITITISKNQGHPIDQSQGEGMDSVGFVVSLATQRKIVRLTRKHKKK